MIVSNSRERMTRAMSGTIRLAVARRNQQTRVFNAARDFSDRDLTIMRQADERTVSNDK